jgi:hypothetical protein
VSDALHAGPRLLLMKCHSSSGESGSGSSGRSFSGASVRAGGVERGAASSRTLFQVIEFIVEGELLFDVGEGREHDRRSPALVVTII